MVYMARPRARCPSPPFVAASRVFGARLSLRAPPTPRRARRHGCRHTRAIAQLLR